MPLFSRRKPNQELLDKLVKIAQLKAEVPLLYAARTSGPGKLWVQHNIDPRQPNIIAIAAGDNEFVPSIIFSVDEVYVRVREYDPKAYYIHLRKYEPGDWEKLVDATLESAKEQYRIFYKKGDWAKYKFSTPTDEEVEEAVNFVMESWGGFRTEAPLPNTLEEVQKEQAILALSIEKAQKQGAPWGAAQEQWAKRVRRLQEHAKSLTASGDEIRKPLIPPFGGG